MVKPIYLFDTNILSTLIKQPAGPLAAKIAELNDNSFCTSVIVACELRYGVSKKASPQLIEKVEFLLASIVVLPLDIAVDKQYATLRVALEQQGQPISAHDMLIAAHALSLDAILITANEREFLRVPDLRVENWLRK